MVRKKSILVITCIILSLTFIFSVWGNQNHDPEDSMASPISLGIPMISSHEFLVGNRITEGASVAQEFREFQLEYSFKLVYPNSITDFQGPPSWTEASIYSQHDPDSFLLHADKTQCEQPHELWIQPYEYDTALLVVAFRHDSKGNSLGGVVEFLDKQNNVLNEFVIPPRQWTVGTVVNGPAINTSHPKCGQHGVPVNSDWPGSEKGSIYHGPGATVDITGSIEISNQIPEQLQGVEMPHFEGDQMYEMGYRRYINGVLEFDSTISSGDTRIVVYKGQVVESWLHDGQDAVTENKELTFQFRVDNAGNVLGVFPGGQSTLDSLLVNSRGLRFSDLISSGGLQTVGSMVELFRGGYTENVAGQLRARFTSSANVYRGDGFTYCLPIHWDPSAVKVRVRDFPSSPYFGGCSSDGYTDARIFITPIFLFQVPFRDDIPLADQNPDIYRGSRFYSTSQPIQEDTVGLNLDFVGTKYTTNLGISIPARVGYVTYRTIDEADGNNTEASTEKIERWFDVVHWDLFNALDISDNWIPKDMSDSISINRFLEFIRESQRLSDDSTYNAIAGGGIRIVREPKNPTGKPLVSTQYFAQRQKSAKQWAKEVGTPVLLGEVTLGFVPSHLEVDVVPKEHPIYKNYYFEARDGYFNPRYFNPHQDITCVVKGNAPHYPTKVELVTIRNESIIELTHYRDINVGREYYIPYKLLDSVIYDSWIPPIPDVTRQDGFDDLVSSGLRCKVTVSSPSGNVDKAVSDTIKMTGCVRVDPVAFMKEHQITQKASPYKTDSPMWLRIIKTEANNFRSGNNPEYELLTLLSGIDPFASLLTTSTGILLDYGYKSTYKGLTNTIYAACPDRMNRVRVYHTFNESEFRYENAHEQSIMRQLVLMKLLYQSFHFADELSGSTFTAQARLMNNIVSKQPNSRLNIWNEFNIPKFDQGSLFYRGAYSSIMTGGIISRTATASAIPTIVGTNNRSVSLIGDMAADKALNLQLSYPACAGVIALLNNRAPDAAQNFRNALEAVMKEDFFCLPGPAIYNTDTTKYEFKQGYAREVSDCISLGMSPECISKITIVGKPPNAVCQVTDNERFYNEITNSRGRCNALGQWSRR